MRTCLIYTYGEVNNSKFKKTAKIFPEIYYHSNFNVISANVSNMRQNYSIDKQGPMKQINKNRNYETAVKVESYVWFTCNVDPIYDFIIDKY